MDQVVYETYSTKTCAAAVKDLQGCSKSAALETGKVEQALGFYGLGQ